MIEITVKMDFAGGVNLYDPAVFESQIFGGFTSSTIDATWDGYSYVTLSDPATGYRMLLMGTRAFNVDSTGSLLPDSPIGAVNVIAPTGFTYLWLMNLPSIPMQSLLDADDFFSLVPGQPITVTTTQFDDVLRGGTGADLLRGLTGNDVYYVGAGDTVVDTGGTDTVRAAVSWTLGPDIENLELLEGAHAGTGNNGSNALVGNAGNNVLAGLLGDDLLRGLAGDDVLDAGAGTNRIEGGPGNDTYLLGSPTDVLVEAADEGTDTVQVQWSYTLPANFENLVLTTLSPLSGTGNASDNVIWGNAARNVLTGLEGSDTLYGGGASDLIHPGPGSDAIDGGPGLDIATFGPRANYGITYEYGAIRVTDEGAGTTDTVRDVEHLRFSDGLMLGKLVSAEGDLDGDGRSDVVLRHLDLGTLRVIGIDGTTTTASGDAAIAPPSDWTLMGQGDFDGDARTDLLWQQDGGLVAMWRMNGAQYADGAGVMTISTDWHATGTGDFDADGKDDILWRHDDGTIGVWMMDGYALKGGGIVLPATLDWRVTGTADFDGDGKADILWQNDSGMVGMWLMDGTTLTGGGALFAPPVEWRMIGTSDTDGDGRSDILWRRDNGDVGIWLMDGTTLAGGGITHNKPIGNTIVASGDFNADGKGDLLWQDSSGTLQIELMNGLTPLSTGNIGTLSGDWVIA